MTTEMSTPYNWCDARCERCMLVSRCDVAQWPGPDRDPLTAGQLEPSHWGEEAPEASDDRLASDAPSRQAAEARDQLDDPPTRPERSLADAAIAIVLLSKAADVSARQQFWSVHNELDRLLVANREVREAAWIALRALTESGDAPSPFAIARDTER
jgi:hypothetical protein